MSSSSSEEDFLLKENKENRPSTQNKILPAFPQIEHFVPNHKSQVNKYIDGNELPEKISSNRINIITHGKYNYVYLIIILCITHIYEYAALLILFIFFVYRCQQTNCKW